MLSLDNTTLGGNLESKLSMYSHSLSPRQNLAQGKFHNTIAITQNCHKVYPLGAWIKPI